MKNLQQVRTEVNQNLDEVRTELLSGGRKVWLAGLGVAGTVTDESLALFDRLVEKGKQRQLPSLDLLGKAPQQVNLAVKDLGHRLGEAVEEGTARVLERFGIPSRTEVQSLIDRVERLNARLATMNPHA